MKIEKEIRERIEELMHERESLRLSVSPSAINRVSVIVSLINELNWILGERDAIKMLNKGDTKMKKLLVILIKGYKTHEIIESESFCSMTNAMQYAKKYCQNNKYHNYKIYKLDNNKIIELTKHDIESAILEEFTI